MITIDIEKIKMLSEFAIANNLSKKEYVEFNNDFEELMEHALDKCIENSNEGIRLDCFMRIGQRLFFFVDAYVDIKNDFFEIIYQRVSKKKYIEELEKRTGKYN